MGEPEEPKRPFFKSPFFWGFIIGAAVLTGLPFLQRPMLRAPPPLSKLSVESVKSTQGEFPLAGAVWILCLAESGCTAVASDLPRHLDDLGGRARVATFHAAQNPKLTEDLFLTARNAGFDAGSADGVPVFWLIDQERAVRGYWSTESLGQGNVLNAARMLAKEGPRP